MRFHPRRILITISVFVSVLILSPIVILTHMRSGSSYTGDLLQQHEDAFYVYEPLRALQNYQRSFNRLSYSSRNRWRPSGYNVTETQFLALVGLLTCDFSKVYKQFFQDDMFLNYGTKTKLFVTCHNTSNIRGPGGVMILNVERAAACLDQLKDLCVKSKYRIIKTLRVSMTMLSELRKEIGNLKVVNLVRDPRGTIASLKNLGCSRVQNCGGSLCSSLWDVVAKKEEQARQNPDTFYNNFYTVKYEDLIQRPMTHASKLYKFLGIPFTPDIQSYILNLTLFDRNFSGCAVCKEPWQMGNSSATVSDHVMGWRRKLNREEVKQIELMCGRVIQHYNYTMLTDVKTS